MSQHWRQRPEGGGYFAMWLLRGFALTFGRRFACALMYPVTLYFFLRRGPERRASRAFLRRVLGRPARNREVLRHLRAFAVTTLDRVFFLARGERDFDLQVEGLDALLDALDGGRGVLLLGSHHGSFEALRVVSGRYPQVPLRVVLDKQQTPAMTVLLEALAPDIGARVVDGAQDPVSVVLALGEAAAQGHMIALLADRGRPGEAMHAAPFLGDPAPFPTGPWLLAGALRVPVVLCFGLYLGGNRYRLVFEAFADTVELPRGRRQAALDACVDAYARRLEAHVRAMPFNWFNFYDFWHLPPTPSGEPDRTEGAP